ncbi:MAG: hypothetical protein LBJ67_03030 [Planctomycetaceae bacterium]|nr:hypothetical protein [Planctomycetaceae bacterium]
MLFCEILACGAALPQTEQDINKYEEFYIKLSEMNLKVHEMIYDNEVSPEKTMLSIRQFEEMTQESPALYIERMGDILGAFPNNDKGTVLVENSKDIFDKIIFYPLKISDIRISGLKVKYLMDTQIKQIQTLLLLRFRTERTDIPHEHNPWRFKPAKADVLNDCNSVLRKKYAERLLELYQGIVLQIDENYDPNSNEMIILDRRFVPPDSYKEHYIPGMDMSNVEDQATREAYKKYREEQQEQRRKHDKMLIQRDARDIRKRFEKDVQEYLIERYSFLPYRKSKLETMLKEKKVDSKLVDTILDAVGKVEKEYPDDGFRLWQSRDKIFQTDAKFIALKNDVVTLAKRNSKQTTIELSVLRPEDQDYVKSHLALKQKKSEDKPAP